MNKELELKRENWAAECSISPRDKFDIAYRTWDAAIQAVIELIGDYDKTAVVDQAKHEDSDGYFGFLSGSEWQYVDIMKRLK